ncbi:Uncharacterised protein [Bordetella pertussis]|nr:Uncharacterised protein [Bordetella pertussis]
MRGRKLPAQAGFVGAAAHDHLAARQRQRQEGIQVLLARHAAHAEKQRARQLGQEIARPGRETARIDAARPYLQIAQAAPRHDVAHGGRGYQDPLRRPVEPAQVAPRQARRNAHARLQVVGKHRVERSGEAPAAAQRHAARGQAQRPFRGDVQRIGHDIAQHAAQLAPRLQAQAQVRLGRRRHGTAALRADHDQLVPPILQQALHGGPGTDHAVDLRMPGIRDEDDAHGAGRQVDNAAI